MTSAPPSSFFIPDSELARDLLTYIELQVARRADQLACGAPGAVTLQCWLRAEQEIIGEVVLPRPPEVSAGAPQESQFPR